MNLKGKEPCFLLIVPKQLTILNDKSKAIKYLY